MDNVFTQYADNNTYTPDPQSNGIMVENRFYGDYNGKVLVAKVDVIPSGPKAGGILIHMTSQKLAANGEEITDGFFAPRQGTDINIWKQTQVNRITAAMKSAGLAVPAQVNIAQLKELLDQLVGKVVTISQWTKAGETRPRVNYKFDNGIQQPAIQTTPVVQAAVAQPVVVQAQPVVQPIAQPAVQPVQQNASTTAYDLSMLPA